MGGDELEARQLLQDAGEHEPQNRQGGVDPEAQDGDEAVVLHRLGVYRGGGMEEQGYVQLHGLLVDGHELVEVEGLPVDVRHQRPPSQPQLLHGPLQLLGGGLGDLQREGCEGLETFGVLLDYLAEAVVGQLCELYTLLGDFPLDAGSRQGEDMHLYAAPVHGLEPFLDVYVGADDDVVIPLVVDEKPPLGVSLHSRITSSLAELLHVGFGVEMVVHVDVHHRITTILRFHGFKKQARQVKLSRKVVPILNIFIKENFFTLQFRVDP